MAFRWAGRTMGKHRIHTMGALAACIVAIASTCAGQDATVITRQFPNPNPPLAGAVGSITTEVTCPAVRLFPVGQTDVGRSVRITVSKPGSGYRDVANLLLLGGAMTAFQVCPMAHVDGGSQVPDRTVDSLVVLARASEGEPFRQSLYAAHFANDSGQWAQVIDILAVSEAAGSAPQAPPAPPSAVVAPPAAAVAPPTATVASPPPVQLGDQQPAATQSAADAAQQQPLATDQTSQAAGNRVPVGRLWLWATLALLTAALVLIFQRRIAIMRWYYFHFEPHPAEPIVRAAIVTSGASSTNLARLADALGDLPRHNAVLRGVRIEQAERLYGELRAASIARQQAYAERAKHEALELHEQTAFRGMQEALALAAVALEKAKAAYATAITLKRRGA